MYSNLFRFVTAETLSAGYLFTPVEYQRTGGTIKLGLELAGIEPRSLVGSSLKLLSPTLAEGANPLACSPRRGRTPFEPPVAASYPRRLFPNEPRNPIRRR
jgi:hypothetical protein